MIKTTPIAIEMMKRLHYFIHNSVILPLTLHNDEAKAKIFIKTEATIACVA